MLTIDLSELHYDIDTQLKEVLILPLQDIDEDKNIAYLPNGDPVAFYQVVPITTQEWIAINEAADPFEIIHHLPFPWEPKRSSTV